MVTLKQETKLFCVISHKTGVKYLVWSCSVPFLGYGVLDSHNYDEAEHQGEEMIMTSSDYDTTRALKVTITVRPQF